jgi:thiamine-monophosphate kinase
MLETRIVDRIRKLAEDGPHNKQIITAIGDDCAILRPRVGEDLVFTTDFVLEGRHFTLDTHTAADIGHKALARSLSDLAAMGAEPVFCLVGLGIPAALGSSWINQFYKGLLKLANRLSITVAGGDLARFEKVITEVMCCGRVKRGKAILRSGAKPGHAIYVTGKLGGPAHTRWRRPLRPEPRIQAGLALRRLRVSSGMDLSDGLALDLHRLCLESKVSADLRSPLPVARGASLEDALHGGEDYELLFTAPTRARIPAAIDHVPITCIGVIKSGPPGSLRLDGRLLQPKGFDHFR